MQTINIVLVAVFGVAVLWGLLSGATVRSLAVVGFGAGAVLGARVAPLFLNRGLHATLAPELAIPAGLFVGGLCATILERGGRRLHKLLARLGYANRVVGAALGGVLGLAIAWVIGAVVIEFDTLRKDARDSTILTRIDDVLALPGPALHPKVIYQYPFPTIATPFSVKGKPNPKITRAKRVVAALPSVMEVFKSGCNISGLGSGWVAAPGIVVTNAHVIAYGAKLDVQPEGKGHVYKAHPIWFDPRVDIGILRVPGLTARPLPITVGAKRGTDAAIIGFPFGVFSDRPGVLGPTSDTVVGAMEPEGGIPYPEFPLKLYGRPITEFVGVGRPGNSGGPLVDRRGHVVAMLFGGTVTSGMAVAMSAVVAALKHAGPPVGTGPCPGHM